MALANRDAPRRGGGIVTVEQVDFMGGERSSTVTLTDGGVRSSLNLRSSSLRNLRRWSQVHGSILCMIQGSTDPFGARFTNQNSIHG